MGYKKKIPQQRVPDQIYVTVTHCLAAEIRKDKNAKLYVLFLTHFMTAGRGKGDLDLSKIPQSKIKHGKLSNRVS